MHGKMPDGGQIQCMFLSKFLVFVEGSYDKRIRLIVEKTDVLSGTLYTAWEIQYLPFENKLSRER